MKSQHRSVRLDKGNQSTECTYLSNTIIKVFD